MPGEKNSTMLSPYLAYFLGIVTILIPLLIFFVLSFNFNAVNDVWQGVFCDQVG